jgi:hypothetical protein
MFIYYVDMFCQVLFDSRKGKRCLQSQNAGRPILADDARVGILGPEFAFISLLLAVSGI